MNASDIEKIKNEALNEARAESFDPNWQPLEKAIPAEYLDGFMWMNSTHTESTIIEHYKHGITRRYLNIDLDGNFYVYKCGQYVLIEKSEALSHVYADIFKMNATPSTAYDQNYICNRNKALNDLGYKVV